MKQKTPQESLSCCLECFKVETFHRFNCKPILTFVNHSSQTPDEKVLRTYPPGLGKITTSILLSFYWNHDIENDFCLESKQF
jgi:hypothetical protein